MQSDSSTIRIVHNSKYTFTMLSNEARNDKKLSWKARGIYWYLKSLPQDWIIHQKHLAAQTPDGIDSLRSGMKELMDLGYLKKKQVRDKSGHLSWQWIFFELPPFHPQATAPKRENPTSEYFDENGLNPQLSPKRENPNSENPALLNTKYKNTSSSREHPVDNFSEEEKKIISWIEKTVPGIKTDIEIIRMWLEAGCNLEKHIKPSIERLLTSAKKINQQIHRLGYFNAAVMNLKNKKPKTEAPKNEAHEVVSEEEKARLLQMIKEFNEHPAWHAMCDYVQKDRGHDVFTSWFMRHILDVKKSDDILQIRVTSDFIRDYWMSYFEEYFQDIAVENGLDGVEIY